MKPYLYISLLLLLLLSTAVSAQNPKLDSLKLELKAHPEKDTTRVKLLNDLTFASYGFDHQQMKHYVNEANIISNGIGFTKGEARSRYLRGLYYLAEREFDSSKVDLYGSIRLHEKRGNKLGVSDCYNLIATIYRFQEDYDSSIVFYNKALQICRDEKNLLNEGVALSNLGYIRNLKDDFQEAESAYKQAIAIFIELNDYHQIFGSITNLSSLYTRQDRHIEALAYSQKALALYRKSGNKIHGIGILMNVAMIYSFMEQNDKALPYLIEGLELAEELENDLQISLFYVGIGYVHRSNKEYEEALKYYDWALEICTKIDSKQGLYNCYQNIGGLYIEKEEFDLALVNFKKALEASLALQKKSSIAESHTELGLIYFELGEYKKAKENALKGKEMADKISLLRTQAEANRILYMLYEKENDYKKSLERHIEYKTLSDSLYNKEKTEKITSLEYEFKYQQELDSARIRELTLTKSVETTELELEKTEQNFLWAIIAFLVSLIVLGGIIVFLRFRNIKSQTKNIIMEQKLLRSQMTPHFMFNSLAVLQGMILSKEDEKSIKYLSKFSTLLRTTLENSRNKTVSLAQELNAVENYLALQVLHNSAYEYQIKIEDNIDVNSLEIPVMLIQPFAENAIEHAFTESLNKQLVEIGVYFKNNALICTITDNGIGIDTQEKVLRKDKKSLATAITSERLKILSKSFKMKGSITIEDRKKYNENGTLVTIEIPYKVEK